VSRYLGVELPAIISSFVSDGMPHCFPEILETKADLAVLHSIPVNNTTRRTLYTRQADLDAWSPYLLLHGDYEFFFGGTPAFTRFVEDKLHWVLNIPHWPGPGWNRLPHGSDRGRTTMYPASYRWDFLTAPGLPC